MNANIGDAELSVSTLTFFWRLKKWKKKRKKKILVILRDHLWLSSFSFFSLLLFFLFFSLFSFIFFFCSFLLFCVSFSSILSISFLVLHFLSTGKKFAFVETLIFFLEIYNFFMNECSPKLSVTLDRTT